MSKGKLAAIRSTVSVPQNIAMTFPPRSIVDFCNDVLDTPLALIVDVIKIEWTEIGSTET
jgi:hypothetical protein